MINNAHIAGVIIPGMVPDVMLLLSRNSESTGLLTLDTGLGRGEVWFREGQFVCATYGDCKDVNAIRKLLRVREGYFSFKVQKQTPARTIRCDVKSLLLDISRENDTAEKDTEKDTKKKRSQVAWFEPTKQLSVIVLLLVLLGVEAIMFTRAMNPIVEENNRAREVGSREGKASSLVVSGNKQWHSGNYSEALASFDMALKASPDNTALPALLQATHENVSLVNAIEACRQRGKELQEEISQLQAAIQTLHNQRKDAEKLATRASTLISDDKPDEAVKLLQEARNHMQDNAFLPSLAASLNLFAQERMRHLEQADKEKQKLQQVAAIVASGDAAREVGDLDTAKDYYQHAAQLAEGKLDVSAQLNLLQAHRSVRDSLKNPDVLSFETVVASTVIISQTVAGKPLDFYVTAGAGPVRIGKIDQFGKATKLYYENARPARQGKDSFNVDNTTFDLSWSLIQWRRRKRIYAIAVAPRPAPVTSVAEETLQ